MVQWVELLTKQFNASQAACEWFLEHVAHNDWWPVQILIKCPNQMVRQMFQRLSIHVISQLRFVHLFNYCMSITTISHILIALKRNRMFYSLAYVSFFFFSQGNPCSFVLKDGLR